VCSSAPGSRLAIFLTHKFLNIVPLVAYEKKKNTVPQLQIREYETT
jgi:hypothetical protein